MVKKYMNVWIEAELISKAKAKAALREITLSDYISKMIKINTLNIKKEDYDEEDNK